MTNTTERTTREANSIALSNPPHRKHNPGDSNSPERIGTGMANAAFVLRLTWDHQANQCVISLIPSKGGETRVFADLEAAFLYIARVYAVPN